MNDKFVETYSLLKAYNYLGQVDVERSNVCESFKLDQLEEALNKPPANVDLMCHLNFLSHVNLASITIIDHGLVQPVICTQGNEAIHDVKLWSCTSHDSDVADSTLFVA